MVTLVRVNSCLPCREPKVIVRGSFVAKIICFSLRSLRLCGEKLLNWNFGNYLKFGVYVFPCSRNQIPLKKGGKGVVKVRVLFSLR